MKKIALLLAMLLVAVSFAACGKADTASTPDAGSASDKAYVMDKGTLIVGITDFDPMDYQKEGSSEWIGFDADMAKAFAKYLDVDVKFIQIEWSKKSMELDTKGIDVVWNGMTLTDEVRSLMSVSEPYCRNAQVVVMKADKAADYTTVDSIKELSFAVEDGSAAADALDELEIGYTAVTDQKTALLEVASGSVDACVVDLLLAGAMVSKDSDYASLTFTLELTDEVYTVGFRKGSDLVDAFNDFWKQAYADGTVQATAETYDIVKNILEQ